MSNLASRIVALMFVFLLCVVAPFTLSTMMQEMESRREVLQVVSTFVDEVCDTGSITDEQLANLELDIAASGILSKIEINRYQRVATNAGGSKVIYTYTYNPDNNKTYLPGDKIQVRVYSIGYTGSQKVIMGVLGLIIPDFDFTLVGRVR